MIFFPYRAQIKLTKIPIVTIVISVMCLAVYIEQYSNENAIEEHAYAFCTPKVASQIERIGRRYFTGGGTYPCESVLLDIYTDPRPEKRLDEFTQTILKNNGQPWDTAFAEHYRAFESSAPRYLTAQLWQERPSWHVGRMLTARIAHANWKHLIFNLFFFFAFAATVELIIGPVLFLAVSVALALGIGAINTLTHVGWPYVTVILGLSGVVAGMLGLFAYFVPWAKIRFFYWFLLSAGTVGVPGWIVGAWYIGWDLHNQLNEVGGTTNFVSHLAGAALGFSIGLLLFRKRRHWVRALVAEDVDFTKDEPLQRKVAFIVGIPGLVALFFLFFFTGIELLVWIAKNFWVQLMLAAPIAAAAWQLYRARYEGGPRTRRYNKGIELLELGEYKAAVDCLKPLAERGHARAQFALANIRGTYWGAMRNEPEAIRWHQAAAKQGHAEAQYALGMRYADGRGVPMDQAKAVEWYRKAAERGCADAAFSLGSRSETGKDVEIDKDAAAEWYYRAGQLFLKARRLEDTEMALVALNGLIPDHPLGIKLRALMEAGEQVIAKPSTTPS